MKPRVIRADPARRRFLRMSAAGWLTLSLPPLRAEKSHEQPDDGESFDKLTRNLLRDWCDGMLAVQIHDPSNPARHGALGCPACDFIHGRCMDAAKNLVISAKSRF